MAMTDPLADMFNRIANAVQRRHAVAHMPASKLKAEVARVLQEEGFIQSVERVTDAGHPVLRMRLRYQEDEAPIMTGIRRISKPGCRVYVRHARIPTVRGGMGIAILSTPQGVMTGTDSRARMIGGEVLCHVW